MVDSKRMNVGRYSAIAALIVAIAAHAAADEGPFRVEELAEGIWLFAPAEDDGKRLNSVVIETPEGLLVVDAQPSPESARELLAAIKTVSPTAMRYLVYSHPHCDAIGGAGAFPPSVTRIASKEAFETLTDEEYDFAAETRAWERVGEGWEPPPVVLPTVVLNGHFVIRRPEGDVLIYPVSQAHSKGDMMVFVESAGVLVAGDVVSSTANLYPGDADPDGWMGALNSIIRYNLEKVVPLRGRPLSSVEVRDQRAALGWLRAQVDLAFADLVPAEEIPDLILEAETVSTHFDTAATPSFFLELTEVVVNDTIETRRKRGLLD